MSWGKGHQALKLKAPGTRLRYHRLALEMLVALSLAFLVWLYIRTRHQESLDRVPVPVHITLTGEFVDKYDLEVEGPRYITASFIGPPSRIHELRGMLGRGEVRVTMPVPVSPSHRHESRYRETVRIFANDVPAPPGVIVHLAGGGNRIPIIVRKLGGRELAVRLDHEAEDRISRIEIEPPAVMVRGAEDILEHVASIPTIRYHLPSSLDAGGKPQTELRVELPLAQELEGRPVQLERSFVQVKITLRPQPRIYALKAVAVRFLCPASFPYRPVAMGQQVPKVALRLKAPAGSSPPAVVAYVDLTQGKYRPGLNVQPVRLQLPPDCSLAQDPPGPLQFDLVPTEAAKGWVVTEP